MIWKLYNSKRFLARLAGLLVCFWALWPLSGRGETYDAYLDRLEDMWYDNTPVWCWYNPPSPQTYWNAAFSVICAWSDSQGSYISSTSPLRSYFGNGYDIIGTCASNFPVPGSVFPCLHDKANIQGSGAPFTKWRPVWFLDASLPVGASVPFGSTSYSGGYWTGDPSSSFSSYIYTASNVYTRSVLCGRAYVLPQRVFETNGWGDRLWDMYGDGRMFLPRFVAECGFLCQQNALDFDPSLWEQLHFRGEYTSSKTVTCAPFSGLDHWNETPNLTSALWFDGATRPLNNQNQSISVVVTNQGLFGTNLLVASDFPHMYELFGLPALTNSGNFTWARYRYIPDSLTFGDFGVAYRNSAPTNSPRELVDLGKGGVRGLCFSGVSRLNGATLRFARFVYQPIARSRPNDPFGRFWFWVPSGLAWDNDGGCVFNWSKDGKPFTSLFKWPLTASWDFAYVIDVQTNGGTSTAHSGTITNINSRIPNSGPLHPDSAPPLPSPGRGGENGGGFLGPGTSPFGSGNGQLSFTSGIILGGSGGGSGGRDTPISSSSLTYLNTESGLPTREDGDLVGNYKLDLPNYSDFYTWDDIEDRNSLDFKLSYDLGIQAGWLDNDALWDWAPAGMPDGAFGGILQNPMDTSEGSAPEMDGFYNYFDTGNDWWYEHLSYDPIFPRLNTLVLPWPEHTADGWDWTATRTFQLPEDFARYRTLLFWAFGVGLSLLFVSLVMALFSRGAN